VRDRISRSGWLHLPIELEHVLDVATLPQFHGDPFDRLLISQARAENMSILTEDPTFKRYEVACANFADLP
jgi:PIN domain nuclease of toxin-antitoxin system